jgi:hypothetical protein
VLAFVKDFIALLTLAGFSLASLSWADIASRVV